MAVVLYTTYAVQWRFSSVCVSVRLDEESEQRLRVEEQLIAAEDRLKWFDPKLRLRLTRCPWLWALLLQTVVVWNIAHKTKSMSFTLNYVHFGSTAYVPTAVFINTFHVSLFTFKSIKYWLKTKYKNFTSSFSAIHRGSGRQHLKPWYQRRLYLLSLQRVSLHG